MSQVLIRDAALQQFLSGPAPHRGWVPFSSPGPEITHKWQFCSNLPIHHTEHSTRLVASLSRSTTGAAKAQQNGNWHNLVNSVDIFKLSPCVRHADTINAPKKLSWARLGIRSQNASGLTHVLHLTQEKRWKVVQTIQGQCGLWLLTFIPGRNWKGWFLLPIQYILSLISCFLQHFPFDL